MQPIANEVHLVSFIVRNMINLVCALAWASDEAIEANIILIEQTREMLGAMLDRVKKHHAEERVQ